MIIYCSINNKYLLIEFILKIFPCSLFIVIVYFQSETGPPDEVSSNNNESPNKSPLLAFSEVTNTLLEENTGYDEISDPKEMK